MRNFTLLILLACCLFSCSDNKKTKNSLTKENLKGKVSYIEEARYIAEFKFGEAQKGSLLSKYTYMYDNKGNQTEWNEYNSDGWRRSKYTYEYDKKGNQTEQNLYNSEGSLLSKYTYEYDEKGNQTERNWYKSSDGSLLSKHTYKYDNKGNLMEHNRHNSDGSLRNKYTYMYDNKGNLIVENLYDPDGSLSFKYTYMYDNKGNQTERNWYSKGNLMHKYAFKYEFDKTGNWIKKIQFTDNKLSQITERTIKYY